MACLLFETFGGFSRPVVRLIERMVKTVDNRLSKMQYEQEASWTTRNWRTLMCQRLSVSIHRAVAWQLATELGHVHQAGLAAVAASGAA